jgi:hypothetical protein
MYICYKRRKRKNTYLCGIKNNHTRSSK